MFKISALLAARRPRAALCLDTDHFSQANKKEGDWYSCGYRNTQMLVTALNRHVPLYRSLLFGGKGIVPDILSLQLWIERAWSQGFDPEGCAQLGGEIKETTKWIGASEVLCLLRSFGIPCRILTLHSFDSPFIAQALGAAAASKAKKQREEAERELLLSTGKTPEDILQPWKKKGKKKGKKGDEWPVTKAGKGGSTAKTQASSSSSSSSSSSAGAGAGAAAGGGGAIDMRAWLRQSASGDGTGAGEGESEAAAATDVDTDGAIEIDGSDEDDGGGRGEDHAPPPLYPHGHPLHDAAVKRYLYKRHKAMLRFLSEYFQTPLAPALPSASSLSSSSSASTSCPLPSLRSLMHRRDVLPLYFQAEGHSRTLVGFEARLPQAAATAEITKAKGAGGGKGGGARGKKGSEPTASHTLHHFFGGLKAAASSDGENDSDHGAASSSDFVDGEQEEQEEQELPLPREGSAPKRRRLSPEEGDEEAEESDGKKNGGVDDDDDGGSKPIVLDGDSDEEEESGGGMKKEKASAAKPDAVPFELTGLEEDEKTFCADLEQIPDVSLLILDPAHPSAKVTQEKNWEAIFKRGLHTFRREVFELLLVERPPTAAVALSASSSSSSSASALASPDDWKKSLHPGLFAKDIQVEHRV